MWSIILSFVGILISYFGVNYLKVRETVNDNVKDDKSAKRIRLSIHIIFCLSFIAAIWSELQSKHENTVTSGLVAKSATTIDSLKTIDSNVTVKLDTANTKIDSLKNQVEVANQKIIDTVKFCSQGGINQTKLTEQKITDAVANGVKVGVNYALRNKNAIDSLQRKLSAIKKGDEPFIAYVNGAKQGEWRQTKDTFKFQMDFANTGSSGTTMVAELDILIKRDGKYYGDRVIPNDYDFTISGIQILHTDTMGVVSYVYTPFRDRVYTLLLGNYKNNEGFEIPVNLVLELKDSQNILMIAGNEKEIIEHYKTRLSLDKLPH